MTTISGSSALNAWASLGSGRASQMQQRMFAKADSNGDGSVDKTELQTMFDKVAGKTGTTALDAADVFRKMDADGSGGISGSELDAGVKSLMPAPSSTVDFAQQRGGEGGDDLFSKVDANGDGGIDASELASMMANRPGAESASSSADSTSSAVESQASAVFAKLDTDGDGKLSKAEFDAGKPSGPQGHGGPPPAGGAGGASSTSTDPLDTNKDGVVSDAERAAGDMSALIQDILKAADTDGDGKISKTESDDLKAKVDDAFDTAIKSLQAGGSSSGTSTDSSSSQSSQSSSSQDNMNLAALLDRVLKQYTASSASAVQNAGSLISISA